MGRADGTAAAEPPATLVQPRTGKFDVVYFLGSESANQDWELRYSLRSIARNFLDLRKVFIVGHKPRWLTGVEHLAVPDRYTNNKDANLIDKLRRRDPLGLLGMVSQSQR